MAKSSKKKARKFKTSSPRPEAILVESKEEPASMGYSTKDWIIFGSVVALLLAALLGGYIAVVKQWMPMRLVPPVVGSALLLIPILTIVQHYLTEHPKPALGRLLAVILSLIAVTGASVFLVISPMLPQYTIFKGSFDTPNEKQAIAAQEGGEQQWLLEVHAPMKQTEKPYRMDYKFRLGNKEGRGTVIKGDLRRIPGKRGSSDENGMIDLDRKVHRLSLDLGGSPTLALIKQVGETAGPFELSLIRQPVDWKLFLFLIVPLLLLIGLVDATDSFKMRFPVLTSRGVFMLVFGFVFANTNDLGNMTGPILSGFFIAMIAGTVLGWFLPKVLGVVARR